MVWYQEFNAAFWLTLSGAMFAFGGVCLNAMLKSRCTEFHCCGLSCVREPLPPGDELDLDALQQPQVQPPPRVSTT